MRFITRISALLLSALMATATFAQDGLADHKLALQISDNNPQKMNTVLNVAANVVRYYESQGETVEVRIVAFSAGLHMLREDTSPVLKRLSSFGASMPNVTFAACSNTPFVSFAEKVPAGVVDLMSLDENGWTIVHPLLTEK